MSELTAAGNRRKEPSFAERVRRGWAAYRMRKTYLVDRDYQYKITRQFAVILFVGLVLGAANARVIGYFLDTQGEVLLGPGPSDPFEVGLMLAYGLLLIAVSLALVFSLCIFYSHRIAGPAGRISEALSRMAIGDLWVNIRLRRADLLQDLAEDVNRAAREWRGSLREVEFITDQLRELSVREPKLRRHVAKLEAVTKRYNIDGTKL